MVASSARSARRGPRYSSRESAVRFRWAKKRSTKAEGDEHTAEKNSATRVHDSLPSFPRFDPTTSTTISTGIPRPAFRARQANVIRLLAIVISAQESRVYRESRACSNATCSYHSCSLYLLARSSRLSAFRAVTTKFYQERGNSNYTRRVQAYNRYTMRSKAAPRRISKGTRIAARYMPDAEAALFTVARDRAEKMFSLSLK
jgi:hypothetical protein